MRESARSDLSMVTIHTPCNPKITDATNEPLGIIRHFASDSVYQEAKNFYSPLSSTFVEFPSTESHDIHTTNTQLNVARTNLSIASSFAKAKCFPWLNQSYGSSLDSMKFSAAI